MCQIYFNKTVLRIKTTVKSYFSSFPTLSSTILETFIFFVCSPKPIAMDQESELAKPGSCGLPLNLGMIPLMPNGARRGQVGIARLKFIACYKSCSGDLRGSD